VRGDPPSRTRERARNENRSVTSFHHNVTANGTALHNGEKARCYIVTHARGGEVQVKNFKMWVYI